MKISDEHRLLFVHVQKTGGVSLSAMLDDAMPDIRSFGNRHDPLRRILKTEPDLRRYWICGFVRNPWARMWSWWSMFHRTDELAAGGHERAEAMRATHRLYRRAVEFASFEDFVLQGSEQFPRLRRPQVDYLTTRTRRADFIGRTESFEADTRAMFVRLGLPAPVEIPHANRAPKPTDYRQHYTPAARDHVARLFADDLDAFAYEF